MALEDQPNYEMASETYHASLQKGGNVTSFMHDLSWYAISQQGDYIPGVQRENKEPVQLLLKRTSLLQNMVEDYETPLTPAEKSDLASSLRQVVIAEFEHNSYTNPADLEAMFLSMVTMINQRNTRENNWHYTRQGHPILIGAVFDRVRSKPTMEEVLLLPVFQELVALLPADLLLREEQAKYLEKYLADMALEAMQPIPEKTSLMRAKMALVLYTQQLMASQKNDSAIKKTSAETQNGVASVLRS